MDKTLHKIKMDRKKEARNNPPVPGFQIINKKPKGAPRQTPENMYGDFYPAAEWKELCDNQRKQRAAAERAERKAWFQAYNDALNASLMRNV